LAAAAADEFVVLLCRGRSGNAAHDGAGNGVLAPAEAANLVVLVWCSAKARFDGASAVGLAAAVAGEIVFSVCRGRSGNDARDEAGNGVLAPAEAANSVVLVRCSGGARSDGAGAVGLAAAAADGIVVLLCRDRLGNAPRDEAGNSVLVAT